MVEDLIVSSDLARRLLKRCEKVVEGVAEDVLDCWQRMERRDSCADMGGRKKTHLAVSVAEVAWLRDGPTISLLMSGRMFASKGARCQVASRG